MAEYWIKQSLSQPIRKSDIQEINVNAMLMYYNYNYNADVLIIKNIYYLWNI